jgi:hypothetical protein
LQIEARPGKKLGRAISVNKPGVVKHIFNSSYTGGGGLLSKAGPRQNHENYLKNN